MTVQDAAEALGLTVDAIRKRVERGTIAHEKEAGRVWILVDDRLVNDMTTARQPQDPAAELVEVLRDEIAHLRRESERKDAIMMSLSQANAEMSRTIRALEAPAAAQEPRGSDLSASDVEGGVPGPEPEAGSERRSWWSRWFGG